MISKELKYVHDKSYLQRHPKLQPKMRVILLDWLLEVRHLQTNIFVIQRLITTKLYLHLCAGE